MKVVIPSLLTLFIACTKPAVAPLAADAGTPPNSPDVAPLVNATVETTPPASAPLEVQLLAFNDFHGQLEPPTGKNALVQTAGEPVEAGGAEYFATWLKKLSAAHGRTVIVAAGDNIGATPLLSAAFHDEPTIEALNIVGLAITSVGNHEFDEGIVELGRLQRGGCHPKDGCFGTPETHFEGAKFTYLAANVVLDGTSDTLFPPYEVRRFDDIPVAFIGMTLEGTPSVVTANGVKGVSFKDEADTVNALVPKLQAQGIHAIVVLLHEGGYTTGRYDQCEGISGPVFDVVKRFDKEVDVVVTGHTNAAHICDIEGRLVTSASFAGRMVSDIRLMLDPVSRDVVTKSATNVIVTRDVEKAPALTALIGKYKDLVRGIEARVVGTIAADLVRQQGPTGESPLGSLIADAQLFAESDPSAGGAELALMNPGGIRGDLTVAAISAGEKPGEVTFGEVFAVQPFQNALVTMTLSGAQLERVLEEQFALAGNERDPPKMLQISAGLTYTWDATRPPGDRIDPAKVEVLAKPLDLTRNYRVVMNEFLGNGGDGFETLKSGSERKIGIVDSDALDFYLRQHPGLVAPAPGRIKGVPATPAAPATP